MPWIARDVCHGSYLRNVRYRSGIPALVSAVVLAGCTKDKEDEYPKSVRYEASCDSCTVRFYDNTIEHVEQNEGSWSYGFNIARSQYLHVNLYGLDSAEIAWVKIFVDDQLFRSSSTDQPSPSGLVLAAGYP